MRNNNVNVLLINPNQDYAALQDLYRRHRYPNIGPRPNPMIGLGMLYVVSAIQDLCRVQYVDNNIHKLSTEELVEYIEIQKPNVVGFGGTLTEWTQAKNIARLVKKSCPKTLTVYGGPNASANPEKHVKYFDFVFRGWTEESFRNFMVDYISGDVPETETYWDSAGPIDGLCYLPPAVNDYGENNEDNIQEISPHIEPPCTNVAANTFRYPARNVVDIQAYKRVQFPKVCKSPVDIVVASRGCPYKCVFCSSKSIWGQVWKMRDPEAVVDEIKMMQELYGTRTIHFREDNLTVNRHCLNELCKKLEPLYKSTGLTWICQSRIDRLNRDTIRMMKKAGCRVICCGFESANDETLQYIDKGFCFEDVVHTIDLLEQEKMFYGGGFMCAVLNEGEQEIKNTLDFTRKVSQLPYSFVPRGAARFVAWPTSEIYKEVLANPELIAYDWQCGEQFIIHTHKLTAHQAEQTISKYW